MTLFMSKLMSGILELLIVSIIPFITWLIWSRKKVGFFDWIGLKKVESQKKRRLLLTILGIRPHPCIYVYPINWLPKSYSYHGLYQSHRLRFWCYQ